MEHEHGHHHGTSDKELLVLVRYLAAHNESHTKELMDVAEELKSNGHLEAYNQIIDAIKDYTEGNKKLSDALLKIEE